MNIELSQENVRLAFGILSGLFQISGYAVYANMVRKGTIERPNPASWLIWTFGSTLNFLSFFGMTQGDLAPNILPAACSVSCIIFFAFSLFIGGFEKIKVRDYLLIAVDITIVVFWYQFQSATFANIAFQISTFLSFIPMWRDMKSGEDKEQPLPWLLWTTAYALEAVVIAVGFDHTAWIDSVKEAFYPVVCFICHFATLKLAKIQQNPTHRP